MTTQADISPIASPAHEKGKQRRRRAILDAARDIIVRLGDGGMTMRAMAAQAGVSPATPYNLFGSKQAILQAVYDEDHQTYSAYFEGRASDDALVRIFDLVDVSIDYLGQQPDFYRALFAILQRESGSEVASRTWSLRLSYLRALVSDCVAAGELREDTPIDLVASALFRIFKAISQEWVDGMLTLEDARNALGVSFGLILASLITPKGAPALEQIGGRYAPAEEAADPIRP